jgi:hypothetical protein
MSSGFCQAVYFQLAHDAWLRSLTAMPGREAWSRAPFPPEPIRLREHAASEKTLLAIIRVNFACGQPDASRGYSEDIDLK